MGKESPLPICSAFISVSVCNFGFFKRGHQRWGIGRKQLEVVVDGRHMHAFRGDLVHMADHMHHLLKGGGTRAHEKQNLPGDRGQL